MKKTNVILVGGGGHSRACADVILSSENNYNILGYADPVENPEMSDFKYLGGDEILSKYVNNSSFLVTIGQIKSYKKRKELFDYLNSLNADLLLIKSSNSYVSKNSIINSGTIVMHKVVIQSNVKIGHNCIINDMALIEHDCIIGNHCHISTGAIINGQVKIGDGVFIGSSAVIRNGITIADNCIIGMGQVVKHDVLKNNTIIK